MNWRFRAPVPSRNNQPHVGVLPLADKGHVLQRSAVRSQPPNHMGIAVVVGFDIPGHRLSVYCFGNTTYANVTLPALSSSPALVSAVDGQDDVTWR